MDAIQVREVGSDALLAYAAISIAYRVDRMLALEPIDGGLGGIRLVETCVSEPYTKDYDLGEEGGIASWPSRFDTTNWGFLLAYSAEHAVGGATLVFRSPGINMLAGREDLAVLWDVRVRPEWRGRGVGRTLFARSVKWAMERGCAQLKIETQNVNVPACRFYRAMGCHLGEIDRYAYVRSLGTAHETMLIWYLDL